MNNQNSSAINSKQNVSCGSNKRFIMRQEVIRSNANVLFLHNHYFTQNVTTSYFVAKNCVISVIYRKNKKFVK